jgi:hypothetical protein
MDVDCQIQRIELALVMVADPGILAGDFLGCWQYSQHAVHVVPEYDRLGLNESYCRAEKFVSCASTPLAEDLGLVYRG